MSRVEVAASKNDTGENFPVASRLIAPRHRSSVLAFYRFARAADDIADSAALPADEKIRRLDLFEDTLLGHSDEVAAALPLRASLAATGVTPRHAQDLLVAFRMDATKRRYADWAELMNYCRYSAAPVGRHVLDVHGEAEDSWPANDTLCAALQVINHIQDCGKDFRAIDRVYVPVELLDRHGATVDMLGAAAATPALRACLADLAAHNGDLVAQGRRLAPQVEDFRLRLEVAVIGRLAATLNGLLLRRDPLGERVHLSKPGALWQALIGAAASLATPRATRRPSPTRAERAKLTGLDRA